MQHSQQFEIKNRHLTREQPVEQMFYLRRAISQHLSIASMRATIRPPEANLISASPVSQCRQLKDSMKTAEGSNNNDKLPQLLNVFYVFILRAFCFCFDSVSLTTWWGTGDGLERDLGRDCGEGLWAGLWEGFWKMFHSYLKDFLNVLKNPRFRFSFNFKNKSNV